MLQEIRFGLRMLFKRPGTTVLAIVALALGIGLTTTMFSIVQGAFLRGLPFPDSERIIYIGRLATNQSGGGGQMPLHDFVDLRASQQSFEDLAGFYRRTATVSGGLAPERYRSAVITPNTLRILRVAPVAGRDFADADAVPGAPAVAIISYRVWQSQFSGDQNAIGRTVRINAVPTAIVGVTPEKFGFPQTQDIWLPLQISLDPKRGEGPGVDVIGRLKTHVDLGRAAADLSAVAQRLEQQYPENKGMRVALTPYVRRILGNDVTSTLLAMLGAVFGVMLIACANVTNLQLARAAERIKEVAVRTALGAGRGRIVRQLLTEGLVLSAIGALLGLGIAMVGITLFNRGIVDTNPPFWIDIRIDRTVLFFATGLTVFAAVASSLIPGLRATRQDVNAVLKDEGRANTGLRMGRFSRWLVVAEVLLSCCLLVVSGLMIKGVVLINSVKYPFAVDDVFVGNANLDDRKYPGSPEILRVHERLEARLASVAGARRVALSTGVPTQAGTIPILIEGQEMPPMDARVPTVQRLAVSPGFFDVLGVASIRGRLLAATDAHGGTPVCVVGENLASRFFPNDDAISKRVKFGRDPKAPWWTIVGIVPNLAVAPQPGDITETAYVPLAQSPSRSLTILASTGSEPRSLTSGVRTALIAVDEDLALSNTNSLAGAYYQRTWVFRVFGSLFMSFGFAALLLAVAGLYGVMSFSVRRRTQEIGVRMALGAGKGQVVKMVLWQGMWRVALGVVLGLAPAWGLAMLVGDLIFRVTPTDPFVFGTTIVTLLGAGFGASLVPALRASAVDPLIALRHE